MEAMRALKRRAGRPNDRLRNLFLPVWLLAGGVVAALTGAIVAPLATGLRGLYLAVVTLGLVLIGEHILKEWTSLTG
jgi:branched-chain amino acid transport system permease protein